MPIRQLTFEKKQELEKEAAKLDMMIRELKAKTLQAIWLEELEDLKASWEEHRKAMEDMYKEGPVVAVKPKKKK